MFTFLEWHPKRNPILYAMMQKKAVSFKPCSVQTYVFSLTQLSGFFSNKGLNVISQTFPSKKTDGENPLTLLKKKKKGENIDLSSKPHTTDIMHAHYLL